MSRVPVLAAILAGTVLFAGPANSTGRADDACYLAVDVPTRLDGVDVLPHQVVRRWNGRYAVVAELDPAVSIAAFHLRADGSIVFAPDVPVVLGGVAYEPRDLVWCLGANCGPFLRGADFGVPEGLRIDAVALDDAGLAIVSFDGVTSLQDGAGGPAPLEFMPADLVRLANGAATLFWSGVQNGIGYGADVVGVAVAPGGGLVLGVDVPFSWGGLDYPTGDTIRWAPETLYAPFGHDPAWPAGSMLADLALPPAAGEVPDGWRVAGPQLTVTRAAAGASPITLAWGASCAPGDVDYAVYEGRLGDFTSHAPRLCSTEGLTTATLPLPAGNAYYLVAARNAFAEGSLGADSEGRERPAAASACAPRAFAGGCP